MKKILLLTSLLIFQYVCFADCIPTQGEAVSWVMEIHNSTPSNLTIKECTTSSSNNDLIYAGNNPSTIAPNGNATLSWQTCDVKQFPVDLPSAVVQGTSCTLQDDSNHLITLSLSFQNGGCTNMEPSSTADMPLNAFTCPYADVYLYSPGHNCVVNSSRTVVLYYDVIYGAPQPNYTIKWNNVVTNFEKGQVMADKLAANLLKSIGYDKATANYDANLKAVTINLKKNDSPTNPYTGVDSGRACTQKQSTLI